MQLNNNPGSEGERRNKGAYLCNVNLIYNAIKLNEETYLRCINFRAPSFSRGTYFRALYFRAPSSFLLISAHFSRFFDEFCYFQPIFDHFLLIRAVLFFAHFCCAKISTARKLIHLRYLYFFIQCSRYLKGSMFCSMLSYNA